MIFNFKNTEFDSISELLKSIPADDMKQLYSMFLSGSGAFCDFLESEKPEFFKEFAGRTPGWAKFFRRLFALCIAEEPDNRILKIRLSNMEKAYEQELEKEAIQESYGSRKADGIERHLITFGTYPFYEDGTRRAVEWLVLDEDDDKMLIVSYRGLDAKAFNVDETDGNDFKSSSLAKWLATDFVKIAFSDDETRRIEKIPFLLNAAEVEKYFVENHDRLLFPTPYAVKRGISEFNTGSTWWWLATPGSISVCAAYVNYNGKIKLTGDFVSLESIAVRPAMVIRK